MDFLRGTRENNHSVSSASFLRPLIPAGLNVSLYLTPLMQSENNWRKRLIPARLNEIFGLSHLKVAVFDNTVLITGANLSHSYFSDRADRYICIQSHESLANYYWTLLQQLQDASFTLLPINSGYTLPLISSSKFHPLEFIPPKYDTQTANDKFKSFIANQIAISKLDMESSKPDEMNQTYLIPSLQMAPHGIFQDQTILERTMHYIHQSYPNSPLFLATGYFNPSDTALKIFSMYSRIWH